MKKRFWYFLHHVIAHPLLGIFGHHSFALRFHNWTIDKMGESMPTNNLMLDGKSFGESFEVHLNNRDETKLAALWWMTIGTVSAFNAFITTHYTVCRIPNVGELWVTYTLYYDRLKYMHKRFKEFLPESQVPELPKRIYKSEFESNA